MASTRKSSTKSGAAKRARSKGCALTKSSSISATSSEPPAAPAPPPPRLLDETEYSVVAWALKGHSEFELREAIAHRFPDRNADELLARAAEHFQIAGGDDPLAVRGFCIEAYRELYKDALAIGDLSTALKALARLEKVAS